MTFASSVENFISTLEASKRLILELPRISVFLTYKEKDIFYGDFYNITELKKEDMYLRVLRENNTIISLCFGRMLSISIENQ